MSQYVGEFLGTFALVFAGTGANVANEVYGGYVPTFWVALARMPVILSRSRAGAQRKACGGEGSRLCTA